jgi:hypothetical protein
MINNYNGTQGPSTKYKVVWVLDKLSLKIKKRPSSGNNAVNSILLIGLCPLPGFKQHENISLSVKYLQTNIIMEDLTRPAGEESR